jgi:hypothetical protein
MILKITLAIFMLTIMVLFRLAVFHKQQKLKAIQKEYNRLADRNLYGTMKNYYGTRGID